MTTATLQLIPIGDLHESPLNPRQRFDPLKLANLTESLRSHGQLTPILVRPNAAGFEIAAGHRRFRAAKAAGLDYLEAKVQPLDDAAFAEILTIENDEREDVHPLEQAEGYRLLMEKAGYDVAKIATRIQRSHDFVHDRMRLLHLIPELKAQFLENRFLLAHAVILAKLSPANQARAMKTGPMNRYEGGRDAGGLYREDLTLDRKLFPYVARSPGELQEWVNDNCRFTREDVQLEEDFPETAVLLEAAAETGTKTVYITDGWMVSRGARDVNERTIPERGWKRADGEKGSKTCDRAVVGIYADGDQRGQAIGVCTAKTSCTVHWPAEVKARKAREAKKAKDGGAKSAKAKKAPALRAYTTQQIKANRWRSILAAAAIPVEQLLEKAHLEPSPRLIGEARAWAMGEADVKGALTNEQLLVALFAAEMSHGVSWKLREHRKELAVFGVEALLTKITVETCVYCGCSDENGCRLGSYGQHSCKWISKAPRVCSNPICVAQHAKAGGKVPVGVGAPDDAATGEEFDDDE